MKKLISLLLVMCLCLTILALAEGDNGNVVYAQDLAAGLDGWYPRSTGSAQLDVTADGLCITGRTASWNSPGRDFDLTPGVTYYLQVDVLQKDVEDAAFILSVAHTRGGQETYENLGVTVAAKDKWTTLYGSWTADAYDKVTLYVETQDSPKLDYTIRDFKVLLTEPVPETPETEEADEAALPSLKELYAGKFDFGTCMSQYDARSMDRRLLVVSQYNIITPENELKPDAVLDVSASRKLAQEDETAVAVRFNGVTPLLNFAKACGLKVHGHVLVWHSQTPEAFFHEGYDTTKPYVTREVMLGRMENYIRQVFAFMDENYPGLIVSWDVVNEAVSDNSTALRASNWTKVVGKDFVCRAFEFADKYAPDDVLLYYNDYSTPYEPKTTGIINLLESLVAEGHIDGYGFQSHYQINQPSVTMVKKAIDRVRALGLKLRVSEMDIAMSKNTAANREAQAQYYASLMQLYLDNADVMEAVQLWGVSDGTSWIKEKHPLLFDSALQPKPAFWAVANLMAE